MTGSWWKVTPPADSIFQTFLVLVLDDRVVVYTRDYNLFEVGDRWIATRKKLTEQGFGSVMAAS